jgi:hypothetical protein
MTNNEQARERLKRLLKRLVALIEYGPLTTEDAQIIQQAPLEDILLILEDVEPIIETDEETDEETVEQRIDDAVFDATALMEELLESLSLRRNIRDGTHIPPNEY